MSLLPHDLAPPPRATIWRHLRGWRTVIFNSLIASLFVLTEIVGYLAGFSGWDLIFGNPRLSAFIMLSMNVANIVLRLITTTPVGYNTSKT